MKQVKWMLPVVALMGLLIGFSAMSVRADDAKKGQINGTVIDKDGKAVTGAEIAVFKAPPAKAANANAGAKTQADEPKAKGKKAKAEALFKATTDADGKFSIKDVPAGDYRVVANSGAKLTGAEKVTVADGAATVTISVKEKKAAKKVAKAE